MIEVGQQGQTTETSDNQGGFIPRLSFTLMASLFSLSLMLHPHLANAGLLLDAYVGGAFTRHSDARFSIMETLTTTSIDTGDALIIGGRIGYWIDPIPWLGLALDVSYFNMQGDAPTMIGDAALPPFDNLGTADFKIVPVSALLMLRLPPLLSPIAVLTGLNPYVGMGPTLMVSQIDVEGFSGTGAALGLDVRAGLRWEFLPIIGLFAEYRYTRVEDTYEDALRGLSTSLEVNFTTHHIVGGIALQF
jgi:hypothetical protein